MSSQKKSCRAAIFVMNILAFLTTGISILFVTPAYASVTPVAGLKISSRVWFTKGTYRLSDGDKQDGVIQITGSGFTLDLKDVNLVGPGGKGVGIKISGAKNVTIRNADITGYLWGIVLEHCSGVHLVHCNASRNADLPPGTVIDESGMVPEDDHGGGFVLRDCSNCRIEECTAQHEWDGIDVVRSNDNTISDGDYSYNGNWGLHLWTSSRNTFSGNKAIWCTTGSGLLYQSLGGWQTYDSQAVGIDHNSNENTISNNDLRFGGDAIFIRANEGGETPGYPVPVRNGSHRNRLLYNDCSFSPNNAIEVDFVDDTVIVGNNCSNSNYGMWLGYARRCIVKNNTCVNDFSHAVEIENGQTDIFEGNVFGWDAPRPNGQLVFLRQNGNDKTPSGPYTIKNNLFYGAGVGVQLKATPAEISGNTIVRPSAGAGFMQPKIVLADAASQVTGENSTIDQAIDASKNRSPNTFVPGTLVTFSVPGYHAGDPPPVIEIGGTPVWIRGSQKGKFLVQFPGDNWLYPRTSTISLTVQTLRGVRTNVLARVAWRADQSAITGVEPDPARIGDPITIRGRRLTGGTFLLNGKPAETISMSDTEAKLKAPEGILVPTRFNLVWQRGEGDSQVRTDPVTLAVSVPNEQMPHLVTASFSPTTVKVGGLLKVTMTVRNNLPVPALLTTKPMQPFTYDEKQACYEMGIPEEPGHLHLRVSTDFFVGGHHPGSWPWLFGFDTPKLMPGETTTVVGYVRLQTPGTHVFRIGLVAGGFRFIDDNAYQTKITVVP